MAWLRAFRPRQSKGREMPESLKMLTIPERAPIDTLLPYLRTCPEANVKELIARNLATGVFYNDPNEVLYWATVQIAYSGKALHASLLAEAIERLAKLAPGNQ
ncbi:MAG: hypothetical protein O9314_02745 [Microcystis sp. LE19-4.1E]|nr:hypothetical protein [Microcystis sp. LE19-4.1E]